MHFYILGGSGRTGKLLIEEALTRGVLRVLSAIEASRMPHCFKR